MARVAGAAVGLVVAACALWFAPGCGTPAAEPAAGGAGGRANGGSGAPGTAGNSPNCTDRFAGGVKAPCCPAPPPDCSGKPDGFIAPGVDHCVDGLKSSDMSSFCSCSCNQGAWGCGC